MSQSPKPQTPGFRFRCKGAACRHSCCGPFSGVSRKLASVDGRPFEEIILTEEDCRRLTEHGREDLIEEGYAPFVRKKYRKVALEADGTCKALVDGRCSVYDARPTLCRAFPFYFDLFAGLCVIRCDGCSTGKRRAKGKETSDAAPEAEAYASAIENARKMYEYWLDFYRTDDGGTP